MRSELFRALHRCFGVRGGLSRRGFLQGSMALAALGGLSACAGSAAVLGAGDGKPSVAILGGGVAGLSAALVLVKAGFQPVLYEASPRLGGRMFTADHFTSQGQFAESGGEFVDTPHRALRGLCEQLGLEVQKLEAGGEDRFYFGGRFYTPEDVLDGRGGGAFARLARQIARDAEGLYTDSDDWTPAARALDAVSLEDYLQQHEALAPAWMLDLLRLAYVGEMGLEAEQQSCLNMVDFIGTSLSEPFEVFGDSDEAFRIAGGSSRLPEALAARIGSRAVVYLDTPVQRLSRAIDGRLTVHSERGMRTFDRVACTLPFTVLRSLGGLETLGLPEDKRHCIHTLGYGTNAKVLLSTQERSWRESGSNGSFYTDTGSQNFWETSRSQPGTMGVWTNFLGGEAGTGQPAQRLRMAKRDGKTLVPEVQWGREVHTFFWARYPWAKGSYVCPLPGQYCDFIPLAGRTECEGRLLFAGEHTSENFAGYMNGAVETGLAAGEALLADVQA